MGYRLSALSKEGFPNLLDGVNHMNDWAKKRENIAQTWQRWIGWMPESVPTDYTIYSEQPQSDHIRIHLSYKTGFGDHVYAYLLIPGKERNPRDPYPAMLALHPTDAKGKADVATEEGRENRRYALELVSRGYVVLAPDTITAGERIYEGAEAFQTAPFYREFPHSTVIGKMIHDHQQGIELLLTLPYVDPARIGAIGHSLGAYNAYFLAAVDPRIRAVISSCGLCPFTDDPTPERWGQRDWFSHMPKLTEAILADEVPFEFHEIMALMAPRPLFNWFTQNDPIFPNWQAAALASSNLDALYRWLGHDSSYISLLGNGGHDFPPGIREESYEFVDRWLRNSGSFII
ncbi:alpha/beta hydrolase family protein [Paenibacillus aceti]|uniref:Dipeptidyl aminopeptidase n=1 Tax=Paenibacillus aceti TaxID=1820010 RepID=A0ABQ1VVQ6_9BACL|nr:alpha/beta fold hydrolase [Paenibacillus aceti]GGF98163.1 hypothetical protein GCM10010913_19920 [Paenibacillus aceti]